MLCTACIFLFVACKDYSTSSDVDDESTSEDVDGNVYKTVQIGEQVWMAENLKTTRYRNRDDILTNLSNSEWINTSSGAMAVYPHNDVSGINSESEMVAAYGRLYNWYAVADSRGLCPEGWRVPSDADWTQLTNYVVSKGYPNSDAAGGAGNALKSRRQVNSPFGPPWATNEQPRWNSDDTHSGIDEFGFAALPGSSRSSGTGRYDVLGVYGTWWSSSEVSSTRAQTRVIFNALGVLLPDSQGPPKGVGFSVRCIKESHNPMK